MGRGKARRGRKPPQRAQPDFEAIVAREQRNRERCAAKRSFDTEQEARTIAAMHRARWAEDNVPYHCEFCGKWHFASRKPPPGR